VNLYRISFNLGLSIFFTLYSVVCLAYSPATIPVADRTDPITSSVPKGSATDLYIWKNVSGGRGSISPPPIADIDYYGRMSWACQSTTDASNGACGATSPTWRDDAKTNISLKFTEQKTSIVKTLSLIGYSGKTNYDNTSGSAFFSINSAIAQDKGAQSLLFLKIPSSELEKLPIGGIWKAKLILNEWSWDPPTKVATWAANITINVVDSKNIQIYFPNYSTTSPNINLSLKRMPSSDIKPIIAGNVNIDACLYDGYNAQSSKYDITMSDPNSKDSNFYITNKNINPNPNFSNTIPYQVWVSTPAAPSIASQQVLSNKLFSFTGVNQLTPKLVTLPNVPNPVYCTPWLINLKTANITQNNQAPGNYKGTLHLKFTPSSSSL